MSKDDFGRIVPISHPHALSVAPDANRTRRIAASAAELLDVLADECPARDDLRQLAARLRSEFSVGRQSAADGETVSVACDDDAQGPRQLDAQTLSQICKITTTDISEPKPQKP